MSHAAPSTRRARACGWALTITAALLLLTGCDTLRVERPIRLSTAPLAPGEITAGPVPPLEQVWRYNTEGAFGPAPALVADGRLIVATRHGEVHLLDAAAGERIGKMSFGEAIEGTPALHGGRLLIVPVAKGKNGLVAYDLVEGRRVWTRRDDPHVAGLLLADDVLVAAAFDGTVRGLDPRTGAERWALRPDTLAHYFASPVLLSSGRVAVASDRGLVLHLDPATGRVMENLQIHEPVHETPATVENLLVIPTTRGRVCAQNAASGRSEWCFRAEASASARPACSPDLDSGSGCYSGEAAGVRFASPVVLPYQHVARQPHAILVGGSDGALRALHAVTGSVTWSHPFDGNVAAAPLVVGETVYVGTLDQRLVALDLTTGTERWSVDLEGRVKSAPVLIDDLVVVFAEPHYVHAFRAVRVGVASR